VKGGIHGKNLKAVFCYVVHLFFEGIEGKPEPVEMRFGAHVLVLDDR
jgi:hypothetical protein